MLISWYFVDFDYRMLSRKSYIFQHVEAVELLPITDILLTTLHFYPGGITITCVFSYSLVL